MEEEVKKQKSKKGLIALIIIVVIIIALICGAIYYISAYTGAEATFKKAISKTVNSYQESIVENDYNTLDTTVGLDVEIDPNEENEEAQKIIDLINDLKINLNTQIDKEQKAVNVGLDLDYEGDELLKASASMDAQSEKIYLKLEDFFDKYIEVEPEDGTFESLNEAFENMYTKDQKDNIIKASKIIEEELKGIVKEEYCSDEKQEITVNGKKVNATKNTISMTVNQAVDELLVVANNLKNNEEFINCFEDKVETNNTLNQFIEQLEDEKGSYEEGDKIAISIYTTGLAQNVVKVDVELIEEAEAVVTIEVTQNDKENYEISVKVEEQEITGTLQVVEKDKNSATGKVEMNIPDFGKVTVNMDVNSKFDTPIDTVDMDNVVKAEEMTEEDIMGIFEKFQNSKLYTVVNDVTGGSLDSFLGGSNNTEDQLDEDVYSEPDYEEDFDEAV